MKSIYIEHNFLSDAECQGAIAFYQAYAHNAFHYKDNNTFPICLREHNEFNYINTRVLNLSKKLGQSNYILDNHEIVKWSPKSEMNMHLDYSHDEWSALVYLNDNYYGGKILFENGLEFKPEAGTIVMFNGCNLKHGVSKLLNGDRYTLAYWIKEHE